MTATAPPPGAGAPLNGAPSPRRAWRPVLVDLAVLVGLLALAALLRLPDLATRGTWDGDQGHDMLVLRGLVRDGVVPLLGPPTSLGDVHHGALYYYLLAPAAALTGGDSPLAVVTVIALGGIAAVGVTWWLARSIAGSIAGATAGLAMAVSIAAIDESTFIWNPNLIALSSSIALAAAWRSWTTGHARWWLLAAIGVAVTMQCHVLGIALLPVVAALYVVDLRRGGPGTGGRVLAGLTGLVLIALAYVPLVINELTTDFSETAAALAYLASDRDAGAPSLPVRTLVAGLRIVSWPLTGLITNGLYVGALATGIVVAIVVARWGACEPRERIAIRWLGLGLLWTTLFLGVAAPSLATVVVGLPNDHYHAFADPMVFVIVGIGIAAAARASRAAGILAVTGLAALLAWNVLQPLPPVHRDGGFPAAVAAADRIDASLNAAGVDAAQIVALQSLPDFKSTEAYAYPLVRLGRSVLAETPRGLAPGSAAPTVSGARPAALVLICDRLFEPSIGAACGGAAEATITPDAGGTEWGPLLDRFEAAPGRIISVYGEAAGQ